MLYAATKATVRKAFQSGVIVDDIAATTKVTHIHVHVHVYTASVEEVLIYMLGVCYMLFDRKS